MAVKIPAENARNAIKEYTQLLDSLDLIITIQVREKQYIILTIGFSPLDSSSFYIPLDEHNLCELADVEEIREIVSNTRSHLIRSRESKHSTVPDFD